MEGHWLELIVKLAGSLGLRREEICGLRWSSVDFELRKLHIKEARTAAGAEIVQKETGLVFAQVLEHAAYTDAVRRERRPSSALSSRYNTQYREKYAAPGASLRGLSLSKKRRCLSSRDNAKDHSANMGEER
mgnify:CR=1 FL=1